MSENYLVCILSNRNTRYELHLHQIVFFLNSTISTVVSETLMKLSNEAFSGAQALADF